MAAPHYVIRGGLKGRERLRVLARVMWPSTRALLEPRVSAHARCLDVGCGGGDVSLPLARLACDGSVLGVDVDETKLALARGEALAAGIRNIEFRTENVLEPPTSDETFDVVYARFVLSHLPDPARAVSNMSRATRAGRRPHRRRHRRVGTVLSSAVGRVRAVRRALHGGRARARRRSEHRSTTPGIAARRRPRRHRDACRAPGGCRRRGEVALARSPSRRSQTPSSAEGLASPDELARLVEDLWAFAQADGTVVSMPRVVQAWAHAAG